MRRIQYHQYGGPETMRLEEFDLPAPKPGEVTVDVKAVSVNQIDWKLRQGQLKMVTGRTFPRTMGTDFTGVVRAVGPNVTKFKPGDHVYGIARLKESGALGDSVITLESHLAIKPAELSLEQAACLPTAAVMAWIGLIERADLQPGQRIFVNGCTGTVGEAVAQVARMRGAHVTGSCSANSMPRARALDVERVYDYTTTDFRGLSSVQRSFDVVYDTSGALPVGTAMRMLNKTGIFLDINASPAKFAHSTFVRRHKLFFCAPHDPDPHRRRRCGRRRPHPDVHRRNCPARQGHQAYHRPGNGPKDSRQRPHPRRPDLTTES